MTKERKKIPRKIDILVKTPVSLTKKSLIRINKENNKNATSPKIHHNNPC